jgi:alpha-glucosidase (family GH31 glycosyl hydrolase)
MRDLYHQRYAMLPYVYTEARRTYDTGLAFLHPLYYEWPQADEAYSNKNEYMFGEEMMVDPVVSPGDKITGLVQESVWIPPGDWIEAETGKHLHGPQTVKRNFSIRQVPQYVRAGAIVPMAPAMRYSKEKLLSPGACGRTDCALARDASKALWRHRAVGEKSWRATTAGFGATAEDGVQIRQGAKRRRQLSAKSRTRARGHSRCEWRGAMSRAAI